MCAQAGAPLFTFHSTHTHTLALPQFFTQTSSQSCPAWLTCCFRQDTQKATEPCWKDRHLLHFLHHTRRGKRGDEQKQPLNKWTGFQDSSRISPQTSKQIYRLITDNFNVAYSTVLIWWCHLLVYCNWAGRGGGASCNLGDLHCEWRTQLPPFMTPIRRRNEVNNHVHTHTSAAVRVPTQLTDRCVRCARACSCSDIYPT